jgi:hypothetical protein
MSAVFHGQGMLAATKALFNVTSAPTGTPTLKYLKSYTYNPDHAFWSDISASVASGAPSVAISGLSITYDSTNNRVAIDFTDPSNGSITTDTDGIAIIIDTGVAATSPIVYSTSITNLTPVNGTLSLTLNANGLCAINSATA